MIATIIIIACCVFSACIYLLALQLGYYMGKNKAKKEIEDKYWNQNMLIAQYSNEVYELTNPVTIDKGIYEKLTGKKVDDLSDLGDPYEDGGL